MVMGRRPGVATASWPIAATDLVGLGWQMAVALLRVPFRSPWSGAGSPQHNLGVAITRETIRSFMGYASSLPIDEYRSVEVALDDLCRVVLPPVVRSLEVTALRTSVAGIPGVWYRPARGAPRGTILYLHGGGYIGTSPRMYATFVAWLCRCTGCEVFVADYRLAPEFPFPAALEDATLVLERLLHNGVDPTRCFISGDSAGGGLAASLQFTLCAVGGRQVAGLLLFSPEVDLQLDERSMSENAGRDILPWNIPTGAYLHGRDPGAAYVSAVNQDLSGWPPTLLAFGADEMFRDPIGRLGEELASAGVPAVVLEEPGMFHVFPILMPWADASRRVMRAVATFVDGRLAAAADPPGPPAGGQRRRPPATSSPGSTATSTDSTWSVSADDRPRCTQ